MTDKHEASGVGRMAVEQEVGALPEGCPACGALPCDWVNNPFTPAPSVSDKALMREGAVVREIETVAGDLLTEHGSPFYRIELNGYCADFDHRGAAENFAAQINALATTPTPVEERTAKVTQADRRAASIVLETWGCVTAETCRLIEAGEWDDHNLVELMRDHRRTTPTPVEEREKGAVEPYRERVSDYVIDERDDDMLIGQRHWQHGWICIARRPKLLTNEQWRPDAERIVAALAAATPSPENAVAAVSDERVEAVALPSRAEMDAWLEANCGTGLPHGDAKDEAAMLHGLAYVLRQIEGTSSYKVHIGQRNSATSALRMALDRFAIAALQAQPNGGAGDERVEAVQMSFDNACAQLAAEAIRSAFFVSVSGEETPYRYHLRLSYPTIDAMHQAEDALRAFVQHPRFLPLADRLAALQHAQPTPEASK